jgi:hypothetical protein
MVKLHPHAAERIGQRGATESEVIETVQSGETFPAKYGRTGFRHNFSFNGFWQGKHYSSKQVEAYAVREADDWTVITVITRYF